MSVHKHIHVYASIYLSLNRMVHSFTCAGILQTQYIKFSQFAGLGSVQNGYIRRGKYVHIRVHFT